MGITSQQVTALLSSQAITFTNLEVDIYGRYITGTIEKSNPSDPDITNLLWTGNLADAFEVNVGVTPGSTDPADYDTATSITSVIIDSGVNFTINLTPWFPDYDQVIFDGENVMIKVNAVHCKLTSTNKYSVGYVH